MKHRLLRVNELLKRELSGLIAREMSFEQGLVSINQVDITSDLKNAHVFVSVLGATGATVINPTLFSIWMIRSNAAHVSSKSCRRSIRAAKTRRERARNQIC
jgi:hypothetical protein